MSDRLVVMESGQIAQEGTPDEVYDRPRTEFVARFLGECNLLPATVVRVGSDGTEVRSDLLGSVAIRPDRVAPQLSGKRTCLIALRPEDVSLRSSEEGRIDGRIVERSYLGATTRYIVANGDIHLVVVAGAGDRAAVGDDVGVTWRPEQLCLVEPRPVGAGGEES